MPPLSSQLMRALRLDGKKASAGDIKGRVLVNDLGSDLRKGTILGEQHLDRVRHSGEIHVIELEPGDLHEDVAARRLSAAIAWPGLDAWPPMQSQASIKARQRVIARVRRDC